MIYQVHFQEHPIIMKWLIIRGLRAKGGVRHG